MRCLSFRFCRQMASFQIKLFNLFFFLSSFFLFSNPIVKKLPERKDITGEVSINKLLKKNIISKKEQTQGYKIMATDQLKIGDTLVGYTRMNQNKMVRFELEILSLIKNDKPKEESILALITDPLFQETGVLAGMSGSPVYYQNQLIGAIAYTSSFVKKPIVGITAISPMLRLLDYQKSNRQKPNSLSSDELAFNSNSTYKNSDKKWSSLTPIKMPIAINGSFYLDKKDLKKWIHFENSFNFISGVGQNASQKSRDKNQFIPGDAIGINLISGDINLSAYGTVTWVSNDYLLAFGHPMDLSGKVEIPIHYAQVDAVVPKLDLGYKVWTLGAEAGVMKQDRTPAILAQTGVFAKKVPIKLLMETEIQKLQFNYQLVKDANYFSSLLSLVVANSFLHYESIHEPSQLHYEIDLQLDYQKKKIKLVNVINQSKNLTAIDELVNNIGLIASYLEKNSFMNIAITNAVIKIKAMNELDLQTIDQIIYPDIEYRSGDVVKLKVVFRNYRKGKSIKTYRYQIPESMLPGDYVMAISSGVFYEALDSATSPEKYSFYHPDKMIELINRQMNNYTLSIYLLANETSMTIEGEQYPFLPEYAKDVLYYSQQANKSEVYEFHRQDFLENTHTSGAQFIEIKIRDGIFPRK